MIRILIAVLIPIVSLAGSAVHADDLKLGFSVQTGFVNVRFAGDNGDTVALAGRNDAGQPMLGMLRLADDKLVHREIALPDNTVAVDRAPLADKKDALFVLTSDGVLRLDSYEGQPMRVATTTSLFRGRSYAELLSNLNFARDLDADGDAELVIPDFDATHIYDGGAYTEHSVVELPSIWRSYERAVTYRPARLAVARGGTTAGLYAVRGDNLEAFTKVASGYSSEARTRPLNLGLSSERDIEAYYNGYESIDQSKVVLREPEILRDVSDDGLPDLITLETISTGVFDKTSTYRIHLAREVADAISFETEPDAVLLSRGFQFGLSARTMDNGETVLISPSIRIGVRTIIAALFSRSITLQIALYTADETRQFSDTPSAVVKAKIGFDFGNGQVDFPTIEFGDFDADGLDDLLLKLKGDKLVWRRNLGDGTFSDDDQRVDLKGPANGAAVRTADLDGDGRDEVIARYGIADGGVLADVIRWHRLPAR